MIAFRCLICGKIMKPDRKTGRTPRPRIPQAMRPSALARDRHQERLDSARNLHRVLSRDLDLFRKQVAADPDAPFSKTMLPQFEAIFACQVAEVNRLTAQGRGPETRHRRWLTFSEKTSSSP